MSRPSAAGSGLAGPNSSAEWPIAWSPDGARLGRRRIPRRLASTLSHAAADGAAYTAGSQQHRRNLPGLLAGRCPRSRSSVIRAGESEDEMATGSASDCLRNRDQGRRSRHRRVPDAHPVAQGARLRRQVLLARRLDPVGDPRLGLGGIRHRLAIDLATGARHRCSRMRRDPIYSPDGARIAFLREQARRRPARQVLNQTPTSSSPTADGSSVRPGDPHAEDRYEAWPSWDPSGQRIAFTAIPRRKRRRRRAAGDCDRPGQRRRHLRPRARRGVASGFYAAAWRPGPGREAGRIPADPSLLAESASVRLQYVRAVSASGEVGIAALTRSARRRWSSTLVWRSVLTSIRPVPAASASGSSVERVEAVVGELEEGRGRGGARRRAGCRAGPRTRPRRAPSPGAGSGRCRRRRCR